VQYPRPLASLALSEGVTALAWRMDVPHVLVYGTASRWLRVHDLRGSTPGNALSICAHARNVQGLALDPWHPEILATFSEGQGEPIKIWDIRKVDSSGGNAEPLLTLRPLPSPPINTSTPSSSSSSSSYPTRAGGGSSNRGGAYHHQHHHHHSSGGIWGGGGAAVVTGLAWSPVREGVLATTQVFFIFIFFKNIYVCVCIYLYMYVYICVCVRVGGGCVYQSGWRKESLLPLSHQHQHATKDPKTNFDKGPKTPKLCLTPTNTHTHTHNSWMTPTSPYGT
jgi:hypothetical protein